VRRLLNGKQLRRFVAAAIGLLVIGTVAAPGAGPARGDGMTSVAVNTFENEAGVPPKVASDLSTAAYKAVASSGKFTAKGGAPLGMETTLTSDPFMDALRAAAKIGADELLLGSVVQVGGGQVYYRLSLYRVAPVAFIGSQIFSQTYPPGDAQALAAAMSNNLATLTAPRQALGTIYSVTDGPVADVGTEDGFSLGDRFNVLRGGQKVAEATITSIRDDEATLTISNPTPGYSPMMGDRLVGLRALPAILPAPPNKSSFTALGFLAAVGGALLAIGHHGQPGVPTGGTGTPFPTGSPFVVQPQTDLVALPQVTFPFIFTNTLSTTSQTNIPGLITYVQVNTQLPGQQATSPPQTVAAFCNCQPQFTAITGTTGNPETLMQFIATNIVTGETVFFNFFPTITDVSGNTLAQPAFFQAGPFSSGLRPLKRPVAGPIAPGPGVPVVGKPPIVIPKGPPGIPKPGPVDPHIPH
jgi:hypothetical protein